VAELIPHLLANGLALGAAYALMALGFVLVIDAVGAVNFAQGDLVVAGGFLSVAVAGLFPETVAGVGLLALPLVLVGMAGLGLLFSAVAYLPLRGRPPVAVFISTIAAGLVLQHGIDAIFGPAPRAAPPLFSDDPLRLAGIALSTQQVAMIAVAALLLGGTWIVLNRTQTGRRLRAVAQDPAMAEAIGISPVRYVLLTFAAAAALAGAAGLMLANQFFVAPSDGGPFMLKAYIAATLGGWGRLDGAVLGALLIGLFEVLVAAWLSYVVAEALLYGAVLVLLMIRPAGLLPEAIGRRA
jgi:branched-chain amino acid transport system permease protein